MQDMRSQELQMRVVFFAFLFLSPVVRSRRDFSVAESQSNGPDNEKPQSLKVPTAAGYWGGGAQIGKLGAQLAAEDEGNAQERSNATPNRTSVAAHQDASNRSASIAGFKAKGFDSAIQPIHAPSEIEALGSHASSLTRNMTISSVANVSLDFDNTEDTLDVVNTEDTDDIVSSDEINTEGNSTTEEPFQFCGHCEDGKVIRITKSNLWFYERVVFTLQDAKHGKEISLSWQDKEFDGITKEDGHYANCDAARAETHEYVESDESDSIKLFGDDPTGNTQKVIELLKTCLKAPELCNGGSDLHYVNSPPYALKSDPCLADYKNAARSVTEKSKEVERPMQGNNVRSRRSQSTPESTPVWIVLLACLVSL